MTTTVARTTRRAVQLAWFGGLALAIASLVGVLLVGPSPMPIAHLFHAAFTPDTTDSLIARAILLDVRLPRALGSFLVGSCLSLAGVLLQAATRNPIADPYLVGTSAGATLAAVLISPLVLSLCTALALPADVILPWAQPAAALLGALASVSLAFGIARAGGPLRPERVLLAGLVLTAFAGAATSFALYQLSDVRLRAATQWLMGGVSVPSAWATLPGGIGLLAALAFGVVRAPELNALGLGPDAARGLGVDEPRLARNALWWSSALAAIAVSLAGIIGFVGLLVPHALRALLGRDHRALVPGSVLAGGAFLCWMDALARILVAPAELPVGILTALAGCPVLVVLLGVWRRPQPLAKAEDPVVTSPAPPQHVPAHPALSCTYLTVAHPGIRDPTLVDVTLALPHGRLVALVGPNGSGKTTLLRALAGLMPPRSGSLIDGEVVRTGPADPRRLAFLPQAPRAEPGWTVRALVSLGRTAWQTGDWKTRLWAELDGEGVHAVDAALRTLDLADRADAALETLSGGQQQRAYVAMAMAQTTPVLLLDEPAGSLDLPQADRLLRRLKEQTRAQDTLIVLAIHDLALALAHADLVVVLAGGRLVACGEPAEVRAGLDQAFAADLTPWLGTSSQLHTQD
jgi:iron complex transport system permease protein